MTVDGHEDAHYAVTVGTPPRRPEPDRIVIRHPGGLADRDGVIVDQAANTLVGDLERVSRDTQLEPTPAGGLDDGGGEHVR